jgi:hypothetical protein
VEYAHFLVSVPCDGERYVESKQDRLEREVGLQFGEHSMVTRVTDDQVATLKTPES